MKKFLSLFAFLFASMMMFAGSYTLTFKDNGTDGDNSTKRTTVADIIAGNADSVKAVTASNVYQARSGRGIKLGTGSATGSLTMTLNTPVKVTSLVVKAMRYKDGEATLKIQDKSDYTLTAEAADYTYTYAEATEVSEITVASTSKRNYIISLTVNYEDEKPQPTTQDLYLKLSSDWAGWPAKYAVYYFKDTENNGWSEFMTAVTGEENTYTATIPVGYSKVIFVRFNSEKTATGNWDDKWSQTNDLTIPEGKNHFTVTSGGTGSECDGVWAKYPVIPTYYVAGTMTSWADNMVEMNEGSYTFEGLAAGKYEIKVVDNNNNWLGFDKLNTTASNKNVYGEGTGNIKFVLGEEGNVTVAYDGAKITVTGATIVAPTTVFTVTVPEGTEKAFIAGNFTKWAPVEMTLKEENVFTYSFAGDVADTASYKYLAGPDWKYVEVNADDSEADNRGYKAADEVAKWKAVPVALKYAKVTKAPINWTGHYIISFGDSKPHMAISGSDFVAAADAPAFVDGDTISLAEGYDVEIRFSETAGAYTIKLPSEKYIKIPGSNAVNEDATAMALYLNYFKGTKQEGVQIADKNDFTSTGTRMIYKQNNYYRSYTSKIDDEKYVLPTLYRLVDEAFDCQDGPYAILVNGKDVENTVAGEEFDGYKQYVAYLSLTKGDSIQLINTSCGATWLPAIEEGGMSAHFKKGVNAATIDTTGCFDLYIKMNKMKEGDDKLYIGAGICADDTVRYYIAGEGDGLGWDAEKRIAAKQDTTVLKLKAGDYKLKVVAGENWLGFEALTDTAAGLKDLDGDDHNIGFTLKEAGDVTIVYNDTVFTVTGKFYVRVPEYKDLYLVPGVWAEADAKIAAWIYTRKEGAEMADQWTAFFAPKAEGNDTLTAKIDSEADSILFVRFNKTVTAPTWENEAENVWNKMAADSIDYTSLTYTITDWAAGTWKKYEPILYYIAGEGEGLGWDAEKRIAAKQDTTVLKLKAGDYKLKVVAGENWLGFEALTDTAAGLKDLDGDDHNIGFTLKEAGDVTIVYNDTVFTVTGKFYVRVPEYKDLYLVPGVWAEADAKIAAWIYTRKEGAEMADQWTAFFAPKAEGNDTLTVKIDSEADSILFVRFNKTVETPAWSDEEGVIWNKMEADTIDYAGLTYTITDWAAGTWKKYEPILYYIAGEGDGLGWDAEKRIAAKQDTTVLNLKAGNYKLKVVAGENWLGFEALTDTAAGLKDLDGDDHNIGFTLKEDAAVTIVYNDTVFTVTGKFYVRVPEYKDLYLVPGVWAEADAKIAAWIYTRKEGAEMADQWTAFFAPKAEGNDTLTAKIDSEADSILFVRFNKTVTAPTWENEAENVWNKMAADSIDYTSLTYTITDWAAGTWKVYVPEVPAKFYITGDSALVVNAGLNKEKAWAPDAIKVTEDSYTFENLAVGDYKLKVTDGAWSSEETPRMNLGFSDLTQEDKAGLTTDNDNNICFTLKEAGNVVVTCKKVEGVTTFTVTGKFYVPAEPQGCDWENIEFLGDGSPEQTFGNQFKVCKEGDVPGVVNIQKPGFAAETGIYVTFPSAAFGTISLAEGQYKIDGAGMVLYLSAFTAVETEVTVVCESKEYTFTVYNAKGSAPVVEHTYTVAGDSEAAFGTTWDPANTANDMTKQEDGTYKWEKEDVELLAGMLTFKVAEDYQWTVSYPADNYQLPIAETGKYNVTITFNPEGNVVNATATKTGEAVIIPTVAMHGNFTGSWIDTENFTVAEGNETASLKLTLGKGIYGFGMRIGGSANWTSNGVAFTRENNSAEVVAGSGNLSLTADAAGEYTFTWTYATNTLSIKFPEGEIVEPTLDDGYYIIGLNGWDVADLTADDMFWSTGIETGEYSLNVTLAEGDKFKVVRVEDDAIKTWFPEGDDYTVDAKHAGAKTIYFRPNYNGNDDWYAKCIYVAPNSDTPTGINAINADAKAVKVLRNGQLLIIKGEKTYNGLGTLVR